LQSICRFPASLFCAMKPGKPKRKLPPAVEADLRFISENMKLSGFSRKVTPELVEHALRLHRRDPALRRGEAYLARVLLGCTPDQLNRLLKTTNEVEYMLRLAEFAIEQSAFHASVKRAIRADRDADRSAKRVMRKGRPRTHETI
jgi:hypothetical protein